jgi:hypothetical protein
MLINITVLAAGMVAVVGIAVKQQHTMQISTCATD